MFLGVLCVSASIRHLFHKPFTIDDFLDKVEGEVKILAGGFEADAGVLAGEGKELSSEVDFRFEIFSDLIAQILALIGR